MSPEEIQTLVFDVQTKDAGAHPASIVFTAIGMDALASHIEGRVTREEYAFLTDLVTALARMQPFAGQAQGNVVGARYERMHEIVELHRALHHAYCWAYGHFDSLAASARESIPREDWGDVATVLGHEVAGMEHTLETSQTLYLRQTWFDELKRQFLSIFAALVGDEMHAEFTGAVSRDSAEAMRQWTLLKLTCSAEGTAH